MITIGADLSKKVIFLAALKDEEIISTASINIYDNPWLGFLTIQRYLRTLAEEYKAEHIYIEQPYANFHSPRPMSFLDLGRACAFVEIAAYESGVNPHFIGNTVWRKEIYGKGRVADAKEYARKFVLDKFGFETRFKNEHNKCEAILLAYYGILSTSR